MASDRKNPEESLNEVAKETQNLTTGKLKIYLGAAPGVGKTYAMLHDAYELRKKNLDVVIGVVESHGREMIESMLGKFTVLPRQRVNYRDHKYFEFDLDAALKRAPGLILVDEMAHTNIDGLRHTKRWQDIKELLDRGIDVYTTLNVQHIESLKDDVMHIIHAPVQETVPDFMLELAEKIELVDLPVDDLLKRLHEGKIYIPEQLEQARDNFFKPGNLTALRELALRATALHVESEVQSYRKSYGITEVWPTRDKILVCVNSRPESLKIIRTTKRMAINSQAEWVAVYVDKPSLYSFKQKRNNALYNLRLAQQLGASTHVLVGNNVSDEILQFARENNVTQIVIWKDVSNKWLHLFKHHLADVILEHSNEINVSIITGTPGAFYPASQYKEKKTLSKYYVYALGATALTTAINWFLAPFLENSGFILLYILSVICIASMGYIGPSVLVSILTVFCYDFFFIEPTISYAVPSIQHLLTLSIMLLVTYTISYLTLTKHNEAMLANKIQRQAKELYSFGKQLLSTFELDKLLNAGISYIGNIFDSDIKVFMHIDSSLYEWHETEFTTIQDSKEASVAQWVFDVNQPAGLGTDTLSSNDALYLPMLASQSTLGCIKVKPKDGNLFSPEQMVLLESCIHQLTLAIEVNNLHESAYKKELATKVDLTKNSVLKTIAQHLNKPITKILKSIRDARQANKALDIVAVTEEISRINLLNNNILQITGLEADSISLNKRQTSVIDLLNLSISGIKNRAIGREVLLHVPSKSVYISADYNMLKKVFDNLLDNAYKFSPFNSVIDVFIEIRAGEIQVIVKNIGENVDAVDINNLFKKFYQGQNIHVQEGLGIGLTICQIIIEAHKGRIWAELTKDDNVITFNVVLPIKN